MSRHITAFGNAAEKTAIQARDCAEAAIKKSGGSIASRWAIGDENTLVERRRYIVP